MNGDLISREALKEHKFLTPQVKVIGGRRDGKTREQIIEAYQKGWNDAIDTIIDNAPTVSDHSVEIAKKSIELGRRVGRAEGAIESERPKGEPVIKCQDCKYRVKEWREDNRMKEKGYWAYGCEHFGELMGYWGFGGNDNEFCSDAEQKGGAE